MNIEQEEWLPINGYENRYLVSSIGNVKTICPDSLLKGYSIISQHFHRKGYKIVSLWDGKKQKTFKVHRLVGIAFIPNPLNLPEVNHKFGIKTDNRVSQLEWSTSSDNQRHSYKMGLSKSKKGTGNSKVILTEKEVIEIYKSKDTLSVSSSKYSVSKSCISHIKTGYTWGHLTSSL